MADKTTRPTTAKKKPVPAKKATTRPVATTVTEKKPRRTVTKPEAVPAPILESAPEPVVRRKPVFRAGTWISILMLAALVGLAFYLNREKENTAAVDVTPTVETSYIFADGIVTSIEVKPAEGGETVKIARNAKNAWEVLLPTEAEADQGMAEAAATQLTALPISSQIDAGKSPDIFGLDKPAYVITVEFKDGKKHTLEIGDITPTNSGYYVRVDKGNMLITDMNGIDALLQLEFFPPYLNTPVPTAESATATPLP